ncbi:DUF3667 domain-containing protein [Rubrivivax rivuli]|uniref:DUF3667 domain-containing protein n=1 Tax=Rubrivivax rivuli TaxID=1862385 RepID=UPI001FDF30E9|nr:DUF3667 domain-containing protein [Rubrivivax rivuli]
MPEALPAPEQLPEGHCRNCGHALPDPAPPFCPQCGQETRVRAPRIGEFAQQFGGAYFSTEGALWRTLKLLLLKPGELTRLYLAGRRKHYVLPLRLYLTISLLVLLALRLVAQASLEAPGAVHIDSQDVRDKPGFAIELIAARAGMKDGVFFCEGLPQTLCKRLQRRIDVKPEAVADAVRDFLGGFIGNLGLAMFLLVPSFALFLKLVYLNRRLRYTEHLVFGLHVHACWFLLVACTLLPLGGVEDLVVLAMPVYTLMAMKRVYGGGWGWRWLRAAVVSTLYLTVLSFAMVGVGLYALLT